VLRGDVYLLARASREAGLEDHLLVYRPGPDRWARLPAPPRDENTTLALVAAGDRLVAARRYDENGGADLVYDAKARTWSPLPADPLRPAMDRALVWTGRELVLLALPLDVDQTSVRYLTAAYDFATRRWRRLPDSDVAFRDPQWYRLAGLVVNPTLGPTPTGEQVNARGVASRPGGIFDPRTERWSRLPAPPLAGVQDPHRFLDITTAGADVIVNGQGWLFDARSRTWTVVPELATGPRQDVAAAWSGSGLVVFGGATFTRTDGRLTSTIHDDAWFWSPPAAAGG
jgi:hypothetical protein